MSKNDTQEVNEKAYPKHRKNLKAKWTTKGGCKTTMPEKMLAFKIEPELAEQFRKECKRLGIQQSSLFRACVQKFLSADQDGFLELLGFSKKTYWSTSL